MPFSNAQIRMLSSKLHEKHVRTREQRGMKLSYIEGWHAIEEANRIFGFDGWDRETVSAECVWEDHRRDPKACAYAARVRIRVRAGKVVVCRDGSGMGHGTGATMGEAHESALKEAETDATKRALTTFGNLFGLALYDKQQHGVRRSRKTNGAAERPVIWTLFAASGEPLSRHDVPQSFCTAMRDALDTVENLDELAVLWGRNTPTVTQLRAVRPELKTAHGAHYADLLEKLYRQQKTRLEGLAEKPPGANGGIGAVDKSALTLGAPKRVRNTGHLQFVASLSCLVCARTPSQAHHLRFAQPRALASKPSDEWTVPLCLLHHRALHDAGSEEKWWKEQGIDPIIEAERLWRESKNGALAEGKIETAAE